MNILVTICARAGSKGVKNKNIRSFCDNPLLHYTLEVYSFFRKDRMRYHDSVQLALNTDSRELIEQMNAAAEECLLIRRSEQLAGDAVSKFDVIKDTLLRAEDICRKQFDVIIDLDLTSPLRTWRDVSGALQILLDNKEADIVYTVTDARRSPYFNMVCEKGQGFYGTVLESTFVARQQAPECYDMNASIYIYRRDYLLKGTMYERRALIWKMDDTGVLDIDSEEDFALLEVIFQFLVAHKEQFREQFGQLLRSNQKISEERGRKIEN